MPRTRTRTKSRNVKRGGGGQCGANTFEEAPIKLHRNHLGGGRRHKGLSRKSTKKVNRCVKKANAKKSAKAKRSATKKCMKLKKRLSKH